MFLAEQIVAFYPDLSHKEFTSNFAIFHQRYSTNTFPTWSLAQPFRVLSHNGEINTIQGNTNWSIIHEPKMFSEKLGENINIISPIIQDGASDSAALDSFYELLLHSGKELPMIKCLTIPESGNKNQNQKVKNFYIKRKIKNLDQFFDFKNTLAQELELFGLPTSFFVDKKGMIIAKYNGNMEWDQKNVVELINYLNNKD